MIQVDDLGFFIVISMHGTRLILHFSHIGMRPPGQGFHPAPSGLASQHQSPYATTPVHDSNYECRH